MRKGLRRLSKQFDRLKRLKNMKALSDFQEGIDAIDALIRRLECLREQYQSQKDRLSLIEPYEAFAENRLLEYVLNKMRGTRK